MPTGKTINRDPEMWIKTLDKMLRDNAYDWAWDRLESIRDWVAENDRITQKQCIAINNIRRGGDRL